jgi:hypothetical protein
MSLFSAVQMAPRDPILGLNEQFAADTNPAKVNLGVGVYYDDNGKLPLLQCVQAAEHAMMEAPKARGLPAHRRHCRLRRSREVPGFWRRLRSRYLGPGGHGAGPRRHRWPEDSAPTS